MQVRGRERKDFAGLCDQQEKLRNIALPISDFFSFPTAEQGAIGLACSLSHIIPPEILVGLLSYYLVSGYLCYILDSYACHRQF